MKRTYEVTERADKRAIREFLKREGQFLLPMLELVEHAELAIDEVIEVMGRATIEAVPGRVNIEVASGNYREGAIKAKAAAGFSLHANGPAAARRLRTLGLGGDDDRSSLRGPADRDPAAVEL